MMNHSLSIPKLAAVFLTAAAALAITGCTPKNCSGDPRYDSLGCASAGLSSGTYRKQVDLLEAEAQLRTQRASVETSRAEAAKQRAAYATGARTQAERDLSAQSAEIEKLVRQRNSLRDQLQNARSRGTDTAEVIQLQQEIQQLSKRIDLLKQTN